MALELRQSLSLKLTQQLVMTPQLQLAIKLLQLNRLELTELVRQEMLENPMLEQDAEPTDGSTSNEGEASDTAEPSTEPAPAQAQTDVQREETSNRESGGLDIPWETMAESYAYQPPGSNVRQGMEELPSYEQTLTRSETLQEHLFWQLQLANLKELERDIGARIIGDIDESGYLKGASITVDELPAPVAPAEGATPVVAGEPPAVVSAPPAPAIVVSEAVTAASAAKRVLEAIADDLEVPIEWVENVRHRIQRFDPIGVGSLDLRECLLVQLDQLGYDADDLVYLIVRDHLHDVERRNYKAIVKALKVPMDEIGDAIKIITQLEPKPGRSFHSGGGAPEAQYITPDIYVQKVGEDYTILLNEDGLPKLRISRFYRNQLKEAASRGETKSYIRDKLRSATWLIRSIHQRQRTIYKVMESILRYQRDFFDQGVANLKPMVLQDVARDIGMHESTISRVTSNKYVHTPQGIFELKYFFNSSIHRTEGDDIASESVKNHIKEIIAVEDPKRPLSDAQIVKLLRGRKIEIARRTVAKYREMMGILPSSKRKQIF